MPLKKKEIEEYKKTLLERRESLMHSVKEASEEVKETDS